MTIKPHNTDSPDEKASPSKRSISIFDELNQEIASTHNEQQLKPSQAAPLSSLINTLSTHYDEAAVICSKDLPNKSLGDRLYELELKRIQHSAS